MSDKVQNVIRHLERQAREVDEAIKAKLAERDDLFSKISENSAQTSALAAQSAELREAVQRLRNV